MKSVDVKGTGQKIKRMAQENGYTQMTLAEALCVSTDLVSKWYTGQNMPRLDSLLNMTEIFNCDISELLVVRG